MSDQELLTKNVNLETVAFGLVPNNQSFFTENKQKHQFGNENVAVSWMDTMEKGIKTSLEFQRDGTHYKGDLFTFKANNAIYKLRRMWQTTPDGQNFLIYGLEKSGDRYGKQEYEVKINPKDPDGWWVLDNSGGDPSRSDNPFSGIQIDYVYADWHNPEGQKHKILFLTPEEYSKCYKPRREEKAERQDKVKRFPYTLKRYD